MKKLILITVALAALTFASCKKENLQPATNSTANTEQLNSETSDDDKAVDKRNKFVGTWEGMTPDGGVYTIQISKTTKNRLFVSYKVGTLTGSIFSQYKGYAQVTSTLKFKGVAIAHGFKFEGSKPSTASKKLMFIDSKGTPDQVNVQTMKL